MKVVILDGATMGADIDFSPITSRFETVIYSSTSPEEASERVKDAEVIAVNKVVVDKNLIESAPRLGLVCVFATGYNNIDTACCKAHNIRVRNVPAYCTDSVSQHTFALALSLLEHLNYYDAYVKSGQYSQSGIANHMGRPFWEIAGKTWGIIGMGNIGRKVAKIASAFGAKVLYTSLSGVKRPEDYPCVSPEELFKESDIISIHAPLNQKTENFIDEAALSMMKSTALLINVGRGGIVCGEALAKAIDSGSIGGAAIDVFPQEPPKEDDPLMQIKNKDKILFSPHIAWSSVEARARCVEKTAQNIALFCSGKESNDVW